MCNLNKAILPLMNCQNLNFNKKLLPVDELRKMKL